MHITFDVDIHRKLNVSAIDKTSGKERKITIANKNITKSSYKLFSHARIPKRSIIAVPSVAILYE